jgi:hypothetical protein
LVQRSFFFEIFGGGLKIIFHAVKCILFFSKTFKNFFRIMSKTMKFRLAAAIALYFLLTLLFSTLFTTSSREKQENSQIITSTQSNLLQNHIHNHENRRKVFEKKWKTFSQLLIGIHKPRITQTSLLPQRKNNILSLVINEFLTCKDIIVLRQTCYDFQYLLHPNDAHMVSFSIYGVSKTKTDTNIIWEDVIKF